MHMAHDRRPKRRRRILHTAQSGSCKYKKSGCSRWEFVIASGLEFRQMWNLFLPAFIKKIFFYNFVELFWLLQQFFWGDWRICRHNSFSRAFPIRFSAASSCWRKRNRRAAKKWENQDMCSPCIFFFLKGSAVSGTDRLESRFFFLEFLRHTVVSRTCLAAAQIAEIFLFSPFLQNARKVGNGLIFTPKSRFQTCSILNFGSWHIHRAEEISVTSGFSPIWSRKRKDRKFKFYSLLAPRSKLLLCGEIGPGQFPKF